MEILGFSKICDKWLPYTWLHLYFPFGKFHSDICNKMADNNGNTLQHEIDFDISKDRFC